MEKRKLAVAGTGMVGGALARSFQEQGFDIGLYDPPKGYADVNVLRIADIIFIAVPTPYYLDGRGFDDSYLHEAVQAIPTEGKVIVIKSTIIPGTTDAFQKKYPQHVFLFNPEFLTEANADFDMKNPTRQLVGYTHMSKEHAQSILDLLPGAPYQAALPALEAELVKYYGNAFLAMRVAFANQMYDICQAMGVDYDIVKNAAAADPRIGASHLDIAFGGYRGYGGKCLPKDVRSLIQLSRSLGLDPVVIAACEEYNNTLIHAQGLDVQWSVGSPERK